MAGFYRNGAVTAIPKAQRRHRLILGCNRDGCPGYKPEIRNGKLDRPLRSRRNHFPWRVDRARKPDRLLDCAGGAAWQIQIVSRNKNQTIMKKLSVYLALAVCGLSLAATQLAAAEAKTYQVTGPVLEVNDSYIVVQKGEDKWQLACNKTTAGKVKVGDKVTVQYQMVAKDVEVKGGEKAKSDKKK